MEGVKKHNKDDISIYRLFVIIFALMIGFILLGIFGIYQRSNSDRQRFIKNSTLYNAPTEHIAVIWGARLMAGSRKHKEK